MKIKHIAFTMHPVKDMARARKFYTEGNAFSIHEKKSCTSNWNSDDGP